MHRSRLRLLALLLLALGGALPVLGQVRPVTVQEARLDADGDFVADHLGDTLQFAGRVTVGFGEIHADRLQIYVQQDSAGIEVFTFAKGSRPARGDSVVVTGVLGQYHGVLNVRPLVLRRVPAEPRPVAPREMPIAEAMTERHEGRLVRLEGRVLQTGRNRGGRFLRLGDATEDAEVTVFVNNDQRRRVRVKGYVPGDRLRVTGVVGQYDTSAVPDGRYQLFVRDDADIERLGLPRLLVQRASLGATALLLLALLGLCVLRRQVRRATRDLAESEARFRTFSDATREGLIIHEEGTVLDVNRSACDLTGYAYDELVGDGIWKLGTPEASETVRTHMQAGTTTPYEVVMLRKDGTPFHAEIEARTAVWRGRTVRVAAVRDVTIRVEREAELVEARREAEEVARLKTTLINNMSHELRTPLTGIMGLAEVMAEEAVDETGREFGGLIAQSGQRLMETLNAVLEMAEIEAGMLRLDPEPVDMAELVREVTTLFKPLAERRGLQFEARIPTAGTHLYTCRGALYRVFANLVSNAIKFTEEGRVAVTLAATPDGLHLAVEDTGIGIDPAFMPHLFEAFQQESDGLTRTYEGTGLGLAICKKLIDLLGGTITVTSERGVGSTFRVFLPETVPGDGHSAEAIMSSASASP